MSSPPNPPPTTPPVLIIGAGISGLLLAQTLRRHKIPYHIFDRATDATTRGVGWGLTLHWSLHALRNCLPAELVAKLPTAYADGAAVARGEATAFPFYDLSTAELKGKTPKVPHSERIRVSRQRLRSVLRVGVDVQWGKAFRSFVEEETGVSVAFEDGTSVRGRLVMGCDGSRSRVRRALFPSPEQHANTSIPVRLYGFTLRKSVEEAREMRGIDPFVVTGTASKNNSFMFLSVLDGPGESVEYPYGYVYAVCISRLLTPEEQEQEKAEQKQKQKQKHPEKTASPTDEKQRAVKDIVSAWADSFRTFILTSLPPDSSIKQLDLDDYLPPRTLADLSSQDLPSRATLMGDALHTMTMYRGEGANHVIIDVQDFENLVVPTLKSADQKQKIAEALRGFETAVVERTRPAVLASRQACLDAHDWARLMDEEKGPSPLLTKREMG